jgi:hypothetical protein
MLQDELHKIETTESRAREDLHDRLERMVHDVEDCISAQHLPEQQQPIDIELDEL